MILTKLYTSRMIFLNDFSIYDSWLIHSTVTRTYMRNLVMYVHTYNGEYV